MATKYQRWTLTFEHPDGQTYTIAYDVAPNVYEGAPPETLARKVTDALRRTATETLASVPTRCSGQPLEIP